MSVHGASIATVSTDKDRIPRKIKKRNFQKFRSQGIKLLKNQTTQVKNQKWIVALMKIIIILKTPPLYKNKQDYGDGTNDKARESDDSPNDTDGCKINIDD